MTPGLRVLVCGGRDFADRRLVEATLDRRHAAHRIALVIEGGARGADRLARHWAEANSVPVASYAADWEGYGKAAGPMRNRRMLTEGAPDLVIGFRGGKGTADMLARARSVGVEVLEVAE